MSSDYFWPGVMLGIVLLLIAFEWNVASKKDTGVNIVEKKKMGGMFMIGLGLAALVWYVQDKF